MPDTTAPTTKLTDDLPGEFDCGTNGVGSEEPAKAKFARAIEEAKAGAQQLKSEAQDKAGEYRSTVSDKSSEWLGEAKAMGDQAKVKATDLASQGKARATEAIFGLSKIVDDNASTIDDKLGVQYGDYARSAARSLQDAAAKFDAKELDELGEDAKEFVRKSPGLAIGIAAAAGFLLARAFKKSSD